MLLSSSHKHTYIRSSSLFSLRPEPQPLSNFRGWGNVFLKEGHRQRERYPYKCVSSPRRDHPLSVHLLCVTREDLFYLLYFIDLFALSCSCLCGFFPLFPSLSLDQAHYYPFQIQNSNSGVCYPDIDGHNVFPKVTVELLKHVNGTLSQNTSGGLRFSLTATAEYNSTTSKIISYKY